LRAAVASSLIRRRACLLRRGLERRVDSGRPRAMMSRRSKIGRLSVLVLQRRAERRASATLRLERVVVLIRPCGTRRGGGAQHALGSRVLHAGSSTKFDQTLALHHGLGEPSALTRLRNVRVFAGSRHPVLLDRRLGQLTLKPGLVVTGVGSTISDS